MFTRRLILKIDFTQDYWQEVNILRIKLQTTDMLPKQRIGMGQREGMCL